MDKRWRETFLLYSKTEEFKRQVLKSSEIISDAIRQYRKPYVAFSGGKDSTVMTHLVLQQSPDIMILHWDYGRYYIPRDIHREILRNAEMMGGKVRVETSEQYERFGRNAVNVLGQEMIRRLIPSLIKEGYDAVFVGLRSEESYKRRRRIKHGRSLTAIQEIWPLQDWTWMDVWAYIISRDLPYLSSYDIYGPVVGWNRVRFTTFFDPEFDKLGCRNVDGMLLWRFKNLKRF